MIQLPQHPRYDNVRGISWSDVVAIEQDVAKWYERATGTRPVRSTPSLSYGTFVHNQIQRRSKLHPEIKKIPHGKHPEQTIKYLLRYKKGRAKVPHQFFIVGTPDDADMTTIYEYKTGLKLWSKKSADDHGQLRCYALLRRSVTGIAPKRALLVSLETANDEDAGIYLTGKTRVLEVEITRLDLLKIQARFVGAYEKAMDYISTVPELDRV
ncbi:MAG: hypothetical protein Tp172MES00d2C118482111_23 [Prokaryotic dsDNA virus sp.]|nr:MAG: hypothetical protein Tp172MES00d2C118482111_23 [Prokaryotic dsDNA virus sp.]|tara:strand:- start:657 stop:1289 length:633 start_codon:yes stop_codon:yes gene_type:complete